MGQIRASGLQLQVESLTEEMIYIKVEIWVVVKDKETLKEELHGLQRERNSEWKKFFYLHAGKMLWEDINQFV